MDHDALMAALRVATVTKGLPAPPPESDTETLRGSPWDYLVVIGWLIGDGFYKLTHRRKQP